MERTNETRDELDEQRRLRERMGRIAHKILVLSGKGGVGKSTVAVNLAMSLVLAGKRTGLLDVDLHGPSVPRMLKLEGERASAENDAMVPVEVGDLKVMSIGFLLNSREDAVIWRGPMKAGVIRQFLTDVEWGDLDYLVVDAPPGTGDEPLSVCQLMPDADGAVIVTTPQEVALAAVRRSITFCHQMSMPVLGVIENMSGFACPSCGKSIDVFGTGGGERLARETGVPFLGRIPIDPKIAESGDNGSSFVRESAGTANGGAFAEIMGRLTGLTGKKEEKMEEATTMRIAIPVADGKLTMHFGHCERFALVDVDPKSHGILATREVEAPEHQPGLFPRWLAEQGVQLVIAGGMGNSAQSLFSQRGITVLVGAPVEPPEALVTAYMEGTLRTGANVCDH